jgi:sugar phosphate isomerase/epimerase
MIEQSCRRLLHKSLAVILDEIDADVMKAALIAKAAGLEVVELRMAFGQNIVTLHDSQLLEIKRHLQSLGLQVCALATPLFKCFIPGEEGKGQIGDQFGFEVLDYFAHKNLIDRIIEISEFFDVTKIRCFSFWATSCLSEDKLEQIAELLSPAVEAVSKAKKILILENENNCYIKTAQDADRLLRLLDNPSVRLLWDPGNGRLAGENEEQAVICGQKWVEHVHIKDFLFSKGKVTFVSPGKGIIHYATILLSLQKAGYRGCFSFEPCLGKLDKKTFIRMVQDFLRKTCNPPEVEHDSSCIAKS